MGITNHNSSTGSSTGSTTVTATLTASVGEIIVVKVSQEATSGAAKTVTGVGDGTANVYAKRFSATQVPEAQFAASEGFEVWWAYAANALVAATITATLSAAPDDSVIIAAGYQGFTGTAYQTAPWDTNASLPASANLNTNPVTATISGISTTSTAGMLLLGIATTSFNETVSSATGITTLVQQLTNSGGSNAQQGGLFDLAYSSAQSSLSATISSTGGVAPKVAGAIIWADALTIPAGGGSTIAGMGWFEPTDSIVALPRPSQSAAPAYVRPPTVFTPISGSAWNGQRDHAKLPPSVVYSDAPAYVRPPTVFTPITGIAWQEPQLRDIPPKKAIVEDLPAYDARPPQVPVAGMAWFTPLDWATPKVSFSIPSGYAVNVAPVTNTNAGIPWFEPPDRDRPATKVSVEQPIAYVRPPTVFTPISGIAWHTPLDLITVRPCFSTPPAFGQFIFQPVPISGMAWLTPLDWSRSKVSFDQAPAHAVNVPAIPSTIAGMAWFEPPDRDRPAFKFTVEPQPSIALTPSTLPVSISGMAWFIPPGPLQRGVLGTDWAPYHVLKPTVQLVTVGTRRQTLFIANVGRFMNH